MDDKQSSKKKKLYVLLNIRKVGVMMQVNLNSNIYVNPNFKARFSRKHLEILIDSAQKDAEAMQNSVARFVHRITGVKPEKCTMDERIIYGKLNAILEHVDSLKEKVLLLVEEKFSNGEKTFKIMNEAKEVLGENKTPITALESAFILRGRNELAPQYWGNKLPIRLIDEIEQKNGNITKNDVLSKALN